MSDGKTKFVMRITTPGRDGWVGTPPLRLGASVSMVGDICWAETMGNERVCDAAAMQKPQAAHSSYAVSSKEAYP